MEREELITDPKITNTENYNSSEHRSVSEHIRFDDMK